MNVIYLSAVVVIALSSTRALAFPSNGDFSDGLNHWTTRGNVVESGEHAVLGDTGASHSVLHQGGAWMLKLLTFDLDIRNLLAETVPVGLFADGFFASLYFTDDLASFDPDNGGYDRVVPLFDMDASGIYNSAGTVGDSAKGPDWQHVSVSLENQHAYAIPVFELYDLNQVGGDSLVFLDNITIVPEPGTLGLFGSGLAVLLALAGSRRRNL